jgi:hypothetical protein
MVGQRKFLKSNEKIRKGRWVEGVEIAPQAAL